MKTENNTALNDTFITLVQVAQEDDAIRATLLSILSLQPAHRYNAIKQLVTQLEDNRAPNEFVVALAYLQDKDIANVLLAELTNNNPLN